MATSEAKGSGLLVLASDLVVDESVFVRREEASNSEPVSHDEFSDLDELQFMRLEGENKNQRRVVRIVGKFLPATVIDSNRLQRYMTSKLVSEVQDEKFCIVYFHTQVDRGENSPGMFNLRRIYEDLPQTLRQQLEAIYVVHPGLKSRLFLATVGRFVLSDGFYSKVNYVSRVEFLWDYMKKGQVEVPEFVQEHDVELENRPLMDYFLEGDHGGYIDGPGLGVTTKVGTRAFI